MIYPGDVIKHKRSMDIAFQVFTASEDPMTQNYLINGVWLNQGQVETYNLFIVGDIVIQRKDLQDWLKCEKPNSHHIRNETWNSLT